jgi:hypothetical protein
MAAPESIGRCGTVETLDRPLGLQLVDIAATSFKPEQWYETKTGPDFERWTLTFGDLRNFVSAAHER